MIQKAERIIEAYQKVKPAGCGVIAMDGRAAAALARKYEGDNPVLIYLPETAFDEEQFLRENYLGRGTGCDSGRRRGTHG